MKYEASLQMQTKYSNRWTLENIDYKFKENKWVVVAYIFSVCFQQSVQSEVDP